MNVHMKSARTNGQMVTLLTSRINHVWDSSFNLDSDTSSLTPGLTSTGVIKEKKRSGGRVVKDPGIVGSSPT